MMDCNWMVTIANKKRARLFKHLSSTIPDIMERTVELIKIHKMDMKELESHYFKVFGEHKGF